MKQPERYFGFILAATLFLTGCAPSIFVQNNTTFPVRVVVTVGDQRSVLSPSPGESSSMDAAEGAYLAAVIPDAEWIEYARLSRQLLNEQLAKADTLTGPQLLEVIRQLKDIAARMAAFEKAAGGTAVCGGSLSSEGGGLVNVNVSPEGLLVITCQ